MDFSEALLELKKGNKVCRSGWNGRGMWIVLMPSLYLPARSTEGDGIKVNERTAKHIGIHSPLDSQPYIAMWTNDAQWQPGWLPSQSDLLSEDWEVLD